eukprot:6914874-Pyramimonas_sp.AAC.1
MGSIGTHRETHRTTVAQDIERDLFLLGHRALSWPQQRRTSPRALLPLEATASLEPEGGGPVTSESERPSRAFKGSRKLSNAFTASTGTLEGLWRP